MDKPDEGVIKEPIAPVAQEEVIEAVASPEIEPDWKELLRLERERADKSDRDKENYKAGMLSYKGQLKAIKREGVEDEPQELDEKITAGIAKALSPVVEALQGNKLDQILSSVVADPAKREYVKSLYQSRIQKTGNSDEAIRLDLEAAVALADSSKFAKENAELKRMNDNKIYVPPVGGGAGGEKPIVPKGYKWTPEQERSLEERARLNGITDVEKYKVLAWKVANEDSAFELKKKYM